MPAAPPPDTVTATTVRLLDDGSVTVGGHTLLAPPRGLKPRLTLAPPLPSLPGAAVLGVATADGSESACYDAVLGELAVER